MNSSGRAGLVEAGEEIGGKLQAYGSRLFRHVQHSLRHTQGERHLFGAFTGNKKSGRLSAPANSVNVLAGGNYV